MPRIAPLTLAETDPAAREVLEGAEAFMGFESNDVMTFARSPALLPPLLELTRETLSEGRVSLETKRLAAIMVSAAAGCRYCTAHTTNGALTRGVAEEKIDAIWDYERSPLFSDAERAALGVARAAASVPPAVTDADFAALREHFDADQIVEIMAVLCLFAYLNRWNDVLMTDLEAKPGAAAKAHPVLAGRP